MKRQQISIHRISKRDFPLIEQLFGENGACEGCWCMYWRASSNMEYKDGRGVKNKIKLKKLVEDGKIHALIALDDNKPVGWCTFGPRENFKRLTSYRTLQREFCPELWSIVCFFTDKNYRRTGISNALLSEAVKYCFEKGAQEVEGFPIKVSSTYSYTYTGITTQFERLGFNHLIRENEKRPIYVLKKKDFVFT